MEACVRACAELCVRVYQVADLREFEEFADIFPDFDSLPLYQAALRQLEDSGVPYRCLRTEMVKCSSDVEYLGKLQCIRLAFQYLFKDHSTWQWFADTGRQILTDLLLYADKDPKDFLIAYEDMLDFLQDPDHWLEMEQELSLRGVKAITFYDVVMDYILMDAFDDLESPPMTVTAVVQNRWLSNGFKETALSTAVYSVLKAKRKMLKFPNGFMSHFYAISEHMSPLMAWGLLGPDENLRVVCHYFKDQMMAFLADIFSFQKSRYTSVEELAEDILQHMKNRVEAVSQKMSTQG
ncbi:Mitoguardin [Gryllus bimaculatus]|nr:Mitoguardin [Gryllus bimaculatus]